ncbi:S26 family signal peptidase [Mesomycoplasma flocculare]
MFALGDNINFSNDSRIFGLFDLSTIQGIWV